MINNDLIKILVIGDSVVGKTTFIDRYINNQFNDQVMTIGIDFSFKKINYNNRNITLQFWDTAGQEKYSSLFLTYLNKVDYVIIMFDLSEYFSFVKLSIWLSEIKKKCSDDVILLMIGNKLDICDKNHFNAFYNDIKYFSDENNLNFFATSAKTGENIDNIFEFIIKKYIDKKNIIYNHDYIQLDDHKSSNCIKKCMQC